MNSIWLRIYPRLLKIFDAALSLMTWIKDFRHTNVLMEAKRYGNLAGSYKVIKRKVVPLVFLLAHAFTVGVVGIRIGQLGQRNLNVFVG